MQAGEPGSPQPPRAAGPRPAFKHVYLTTFPRVWRLLRRLGIPERHKADVVQETFSRVARRLSTYDTTADLVAWVFRIANHTATHHRRLARNHRELLADDDEGSAGSRWDRLCTGEEQEPERHVADLELTCLVDRLVQTIADVGVRLVLIMYFEQMTIADIARALDIPESTAHDRLEKGRKLFRAAANSLDPLDREALGMRRFRVIPLFPLDLASLAEAERRLDEVAAPIRDRIWERLQLRARGAGHGGQAPGSAVQRAMGRVHTSAGHVLGAGLLVFLADAVVSAGLFAQPPRAAPESAAPAVVAAHDVAFAGVTTSPAGSTAGATAASPTATPARSATPPARPTSRVKAVIPSGSDPLGNEEILLLNRARAHLARSTPRPDLAIASLRLHAQRYPDSPRAQDRESVLRSALALAAEAKQSHAGAGPSSAPGARP